MSRGLVRAATLMILGMTSCAHGPEPSLAVPADDVNVAYGLDLNLIDASGERELASLKGRLVLMMVSLASCEACAGLEPKLKAFAAELEAESVPLTYMTVLLEPPSPDNPEAHEKAAPWGDPRLAAGDTRLGVIDTVPVTWLISRSGVPVLRYEGSGSDVIARLRADVQGYLRVESSF